MYDTLKEIVGYKFDLTHIILNKKNLDKNTLNEVKIKLLLIRDLDEKLRKCKDLDCTKEISEIRECLAKVR